MANLCVSKLTCTTLLLTHSAATMLNILVYLQDNTRLAVLNSFQLAEHDATCIVQQISQACEQSNAAQKQADKLHNKLKRLENEMAVTRQQAALADAEVQTADSRHTEYCQSLDHIMESVSGMLTKMRSAKRRKL